MAVSPGGTVILPTTKNGCLTPRGAMDLSPTLKANGGLYRTDPDRAAELVRGRGAAQKSLDKAEDRWLRASEAYEKAKDAIAKGDDAKSKTYSN